MSDGVDSVGASSARETSMRQAQEVAQSQQVGAQQAQQQQAQVRSPTTTQEVAANGQAARLERGATTITGSERATGRGAEPPMPGRSSQRLQANDADVQRALQRAEQQRPSGQPAPADAHLRNGDHQPARNSDEALRRAERATHDQRNPDNPRAAERFDRAAQEARARAGLEHGQVQPTRVDPRTGTETEHHGRTANGRPAQTSYDGPHRSGGQAHDRPHVGYSTGRGAENRTGNIPYEGPQHAQRGAPSDPNTRVSEQERMHRERLENLRTRVEEAQRTPPAQRTPEMRQAMAQAATSRAFQLMMRFPWARGGDR